VVNDVDIDSSQESRDAYEELRAAFTAVVSHELRTPLARTMALLESGSDPETILERVRGEIEEMTALVDDVLFLAELESGRAVVAFGATKALPEVRRVAEQYRERGERADVTIVVEGDDEAELPLRARMLCVIVENLIENALRYAGPGTTLKLVVEPGSLVASDDGAGVPPEEVSRLFERFYRGDQARTSRGTGLGLAIVKHIVTSAGGAVEAGSGPGGGLEIRCSFG
jgi:signal transduction histidine kinase